MRSLDGTAAADYDLSVDVRSGSGHSVFRLGGTVANAAATAERNARSVRLVRAALAVAVILAIGTYGFWYFAGGKHTIIEALYMTVISITTVGFSEVIPIRDDGMRVFTMTIILVGGASIVYFLAAAAAFVVEGDFLYGFWRRRLRARLGSLERHVVVCGLGRVGSHAFRELHNSRTRVVGVDRDGERVENLVGRLGDKILFAVGDAADEAVLRAVRVDHANALIAALADDRDNFLLCVTARELNPKLRLIVRLVDPANADMFADVRAEAIVFPPALSGTRMANDLLRPELTAFTGRLLAGDAHKSELVEVAVPPGSAVIGHTLGALDLAGRSGALVVGHRRGAPAGTGAEVAALPSPRTFAFRPGPEVRLLLGDVLLLHATRNERKVLQELLTDARPLPPVRAPMTEILPVLRLDGVRKVGVEPPGIEGPGSAIRRRGHVVVAGAGAVGRAVVAELTRQGTDVVVIDKDEAHLALVAPTAGQDHGHVECVRADLVARPTLARVDLATARGFITALQPLRDNLFLAAMVRHANARARVVARVGNSDEAKRLRAVGAAVTNPGEIGGVHLAHLAIHPELVEFAAGLEATWDRTEQLAILPIAGRPGGRAKRLGELQIQQATGCVVLGMRGRASPVFAYHPTNDAKLLQGGALIALGDPNQLEALRGLIAGGAAAPSGRA